MSCRRGHDAKVKQSTRPPTNTAWQVNFCHPLIHVKMLDDLLFQHRFWHDLPH